MCQKSVLTCRSALQLGLLLVTCYPVAGNAQTVGDTFIDTSEWVQSSSPIRDNGAIRGHITETIVRGYRGPSYDRYYDGNPSNSAIEFSADSKIQPIVYENSAPGQATSLEPPPRPTPDPLVQNANFNRPVDNGRVDGNPHRLENSVATQAAYQQPAAPRRLIHTGYAPPIHASSYNPQPYNPQPYNPQPYNPQPYNPQPYNPQPYNPQPYNPQPYNPQPYNPQPYNPQPYNPQPYNPQPYNPQPYNPQPYNPQPYNPQPYNPQPYNPQPYNPQPYNPQPYTAPQPYPTQQVFQQPAANPQVMHASYIQSGYPPQQSSTPAAYTSTLRNCCDPVYYAQTQFVTPNTNSGPGALRTYPQYGSNPYPNPGYSISQPYVRDTWVPMIPLRSMPYGTYLGQGIIGQPVAYVDGEPVRNFLRYIFP